MQEEASNLDTMFSRGIDPDVAQPHKCHAHPEAPPAWPPKADIISYVQQVQRSASQHISVGLQGEARSSLQCSPGRHGQRCLARLLGLGFRGTTICMEVLLLVVFLAYSMHVLSVVRLARLRRSCADVCVQLMAETGMAALQDLSRC